MSSHDSTNLELLTLALAVTEKLQPDSTKSDHVVAEQTLTGKVSEYVMLWLRLETPARV
jgi:hypothetical protein